MIQNRRKKIVKKIFQEKEAEDRSYYKNRKLTAVSQAQQIIETNREMMTSFGPVIIS
jgi:hypothetical protein